MSRPGDHSGGGAGAISLAHAAPFRLGDVEVYPATRQMVRGGRSETLEPRVMQVLVAFAQAEGAILTHDELIERCWGGTVVGENAIHRVISRVRDVAANLGGNAFQLETITKVGYRMIVDGAPPPTNALLPAERPRSALDRRVLLGGGAALGIGGAAAYFWNRAPAGHVPLAEAVELFRRGDQVQRMGLYEQSEQAVAYFAQAVEVDPLYADAWGALALSYWHALDGVPDGREANLADHIRSAARRALALDPGNADAQVALILVKPYFRNWAAFESDVRNLLVPHPDHWLLRAELAGLLYQVGRWNEGIEHGRKVLAIDPFLPMAHNSLARALWSAGRLREAETMIDAAIARWPSHFILWNMKYELLAFSGRASAAIASFTDPARSAFAVSPSAVPNRILLARAIEGRDPSDVAAALKIYRAQALDHLANIPRSATMFAALGQVDMTFDALDGYFLGKGPFVGANPAIGPYARRLTSFLFTPPMAPLRADPRFAALAETIGLGDYWRETKSVPDYLR